MMRFLRWLCVYREITVVEFAARMKRLPKVTRNGPVRERRLTWEEQRSRVEEQP
jgi:hypothetical protein